MWGCACLCNTPILHITKINAETTTSCGMDEQNQSHGAHYLSKYNDGLETPSLNCDRLKLICVYTCMYKHITHVDESNWLKWFNRILISASSSKLYLNYVAVNCINYVMQTDLTSSAWDRQLNKGVSIKQSALTEKWPLECTISQLASLSLRLTPSLYVYMCV